MALSQIIKTRTGAAFLMATSAIGPGFLTQTTVFTVQLGASFGFVILLSTLLDLGAQLNIWRVVVATGKRAPAIADEVLKGLGLALTLLVALGGLVFNIGNVAGAGLGMSVVTGMNVYQGAWLSALLAAGLFFSRDAGRSMDWFSRILGLGMILLTGYVAFSAHPPVGEVVYRSFFPEKIDTTAILTLVGGTVGGYISFAGAHRLLDAGVSGPDKVGEARNSALSGIGIATVMRLLLFLAAFGVVAGGAVIDQTNPPASMFRIAAGEAGGIFFGMVMWAAAITSIVGATFTSLSFLKESFPVVGRHSRAATLVFILVSVLIFNVFGKPVQTLIVAGALNGLILPLALGAMLLAGSRAGLLSRWALIAAWAVVALMGGMAAVAIFQMF